MVPNDFDDLPHSTTKRMIDCRSSRITAAFVLLLSTNVTLAEAPPFSDYCQRLQQEVQGKKHGFLAGNITYYVGGFHANWELKEHETLVNCPSCNFLLLASFISLPSASAEDSLPRVLIIGDSIYNTPSRMATDQLKGRVEVVWQYKVSTFHSGTALEKMDELLGEKKWDLIHFNFGFTDLMYKDPNTESIRAMSKEAGGIRVSSPQVYEKNLRELVKRFQATGAKLIWASTTPIPTDYNGVLDAGSEIEYNQIAAKIMKENNVTINDMHADINASEVAKKDKKPLSFNRYPLHPPIVRNILTELNLD
jgi:hypothetical protein